MKPMSAVHPLRMRRFEGNEQDPYLPARKFPSPTLCPQCHALFERGRWRWLGRWPAGTAKHVCPACRRIRERYPAGWLALKGAYVKEHRREILDVIRSEQRRETGEHPLNRVMSIEDRPEGLLVTTTDVHLPRLIGEALRRAHKGELNIRYDEHASSIRAEWTSAAP